MTGVEPGECEQEALFKIEGPDEDGCVWLVFSDGEVRNGGPRGPVAEVMVAKLSEWDYGEHPADWDGAKEATGAASDLGGPQ
jgi:hypothetical protein